MAGMAPLQDRGESPFGRVTPYFLDNGTTVTGVPGGQGAAGTNASSGRPSSPNFFLQQPFGTQSGWQGATAAMPPVQTDTVNPFSGKSLRCIPRGTWIDTFY